MTIIVLLSQAFIADPDRAATLGLNIKVALLARQSDILTYLVGLADGGRAVAYGVVGQRY